MTDLNPLAADPAEHRADDAKATFLKRNAKAVAAGITGAVTAVGTALATTLSDGKIDGGEVWVIASALVGGLVIGYAGVWNAPANKA